MMWLVAGETMLTAVVSEAFDAVSAKNLTPSIEWRTVERLPMALTSGGEAAPLSWVEPMVDMLC